MKEQYEEEIDLMDYVKIILKRKFFILALFLLSVIVAGIFSLLFPKVHKIEAILEIGQVAGNIIESPEQTIGKVENDVYGILVREKLGIKEKEYPKIKSENPKETKLIVFTIETDNPQRDENILKEEIDLILKEHQEKFNESFSLYEEEIAKNEKELEFLKTYKPYADVGISQLQITVSNQKKQLTASEMTKIVKIPKVSEEPVKPKPLLNITIAGILGLFIGIFLAFFREWWEKNKNIDKTS